MKPPEKAAKFEEEKKNTRSDLLKSQFATVVESVVGQTLNEKQGGPLNQEHFNHEVEEVQFEEEEAQLNELARMFPDLPPDMIAGLFADHGYDSEATVQELLKLSSGI